MELLIIVSIERAVIAYKEEKKGLADDDNKKKEQKSVFTVLFHFPPPAYVITDQKNFGTSEISCLMN